ncbi:MAG: ABC transporter substrate-binding protein [Clostridia bacterium]|nr:ABC transporter substrate-binding protein [Clostridia bacterium]
MKNTLTKIIALLLAFSVCIGLVSCGGNKDDTIYVGNTAATTGAGATIGVPFNLGIEAAFAVYNANGGFNGRKVALKHYDDMGDSAQALTLMEKLIHEDEIFAVVGNYGSYAVTTNLSVLKENNIPMVYAAAGNSILYNDNATTLGDRGIFPVQPLNHTEGQMLLIRSFAPTLDSEGNSLGGFGASKVGVISSSEESSQAMLAGIKAEAELSGLTDKIVYQNVTSDDYSAAANALVAAGCDVIIVTVVAAPFVTALTALANAGYKKSVLTTYNNSNAAIFNDENSNMTEVGLNILSNMAVFAQAWLDISDIDNYYTNTESNLYNGYKFLGKIQKDENGKELGVPGFTDEYWVIAENIYNYAASLNDEKISPLNMSYNSYALAGYIAGDLFCQALTEMQAQNKELTRENLVTILESKEFKIAMADNISYQNGLRAGVSSFSLTMFFDTATLDGSNNHTASSTTVHPLTSIEEYRALISK